MQANWESINSLIAKSVYDRKMRKCFIAENIVEYLIY